MSQRWIDIYCGLFLAEKLILGFCVLVGYLFVCLVHNL